VAVSRCGKAQTSTRRRQSFEVTAPCHARGCAPLGTFWSAEGACTPACAARLHGSTRSGGPRRNLAAGGNQSISRRHAPQTGAQAGLCRGSPLPAFVQLKKKHNCRGPALRCAVWCVGIVLSTGRRGVVRRCAEDAGSPESACRVDRRSRRSMCASHQLHASL